MLPSCARPQGSPAAVVKWQGGLYYALVETHVRRLRLGTWNS